MKSLENKSPAAASGKKKNSSDSEKSEKTKIPSTEEPIAEKDEVKKAESRTQEAYDDAIKKRTDKNLKKD